MKRKYERFNDDADRVVKDKGYDAAHLVAVKRGYRAEKSPGWSVQIMSFLQAIAGLLTAVIIVGGVLSSIFTVTESGAFSAMNALLITLVVYR